jgi:hypothetical protein
MTDTFELTLANLRAMVEQGQTEEVAAILADVSEQDPGLADRLRNEMIGWAIHSLSGDAQ